MFSHAYSDFWRYRETTGHKADGGTDGPRGKTRSLNTQIQNVK